MKDPLEIQLEEAARPSRKILDQLSRGTSRTVKAMLSEIGKNFFRPRYSVGELKKKLRLNFRHVRRFRAATGVSPSRLIRECRMEAGMRLLRDSLLTVEEIAILIGYDSERSLERLCLRWCGLTPSRLRTQMRRFKTELVALPEDVFSWYFWELYRCHGLSDVELAPVIEYLERRCGEM